MLAPSWDNCYGPRMMSHLLVALLLPIVFALPSYRCHLYFVEEMSMMHHHPLGSPHYFVVLASSSVLLLFKEWYCGGDIPRIPSEAPLPMRFGVDSILLSLLSRSWLELPWEFRDETLIFKIVSKVVLVVLGEITALEGLSDGLVVHGLRLFVSIWCNVLWIICCVRMVDSGDITLAVGDCSQSFWSMAAGFVQSETPLPLASDI